MRFRLCLVVATLTAAFAAGCTVKTGTGTGTNDDTSTKTPTTKTPTTGTVGDAKTDGGAGKPPQKNDTPTPDPSTCSGVIACLTKCAVGDDPCAEACGNAGSTTAHARLDELGKCIDDNACEDQVCLEAACSTELEACAADK